LRYTKARRRTSSMADLGPEIEVIEIEPVPLPDVLPDEIPETAPVEDPVLVPV
jgi:hypothetical protein